MVSGTPAKGFTKEWKLYAQITRPMHWVKNVSLLPGVVIAAVITGASPEQIAPSLLVGFFSACLIASSNYVMNEYLDAEFDRFHPVKQNRPAAQGELNGKLVLIEWGLMLSGGLVLAALISQWFFIAAVFLSLAAVFYNVKPLRMKEKVYLDVLVESVHNPIRLTMGWLVVTSEIVPPASLLLGYLMGGAFLMAAKRLAEYRFINDPVQAGLYRHSFRFYTQENLLVSMFFYATSCSLFLGVFMVKYKIELLLVLPLLAALFAAYLHTGFKPNSLVQSPERLYQDRGFMAWVLLTIAASTAIYLSDIPWLSAFLNQAFVNR